MGFGRRHTAPVFITLALMLNGMGMPPLCIHIVLKHMKVDVHEDTISRCLVYYVDYIRPHGRIGGRTPAEAAGIIIWDHDKRLAPFQNAAVAA